MTFDLGEAIVAAFVILLGVYLAAKRYGGGSACPEVPMHVTGFDFAHDETGASVRAKNPNRVEGAKKGWARRKERARLHASLTTPKAGD